jgi:hypothetical protein
MYFSKKDVPLLGKTSESALTRQKNEKFLLFCSHLIVPLQRKKAILNTLLTDKHND